MIHDIIVLAGISQIVLVFASTIIPKVLEWKKELSQIDTLIKQIFWTYAGYILCTNLSFGLLSTFDAGTLLDGSKLAMYVSGFICTYWAARICIQCFYFDRSKAPKGLIYTIGEVLLMLLFVSLTAVYGYAFYYNFTIK